MVERYTAPAIAEHARRFNIAPGQDAPIGEPVRLRRWGLLAPWRGHGGVRPPPIRTAQLSEIARTPVLVRAKQCIVYGDGWYAKAKLGKASHAWWLHGASGFAGLSATHKDDGVEAFAIVVVPAPAELARFTDVVPAGPWRDDGEVEPIAWRATEIGKWFEDLAHDDERCIAPLANPAQGSLF